MQELSKKKTFLLFVNRIWQGASHAALTDLVKWKQFFFSIFRESDSHYAGEEGILRLLRSHNGVVWELLTTLGIKGWDLRDPKLSITPAGRLMVLAGASQYSKEKVRLAHQTVVSFSDDGVKWEPFQVVFNEEWLWRLTWHEGIGYGFTYFFLDPNCPQGELGIRLYKTVDGLSYQLVTNFSIQGKPSEATLRFSSQGQMIALLRRDGYRDDRAWIGMSFFPYEDWLWKETGSYLAGPNFIISPEGSMWAAGRIQSVTPYGIIEKTALFQIDDTDLTLELTLPSGGDTSYPGLVYEKPFLWMSYYSSHEGKSSIYIAKIAIA